MSRLTLRYLRSEIQTYVPTLIIEKILFKKLKKNCVFYLNFYETEDKIKRLFCPHTIIKFNLGYVKLLKKIIKSNFLFIWFEANPLSLSYKYFASNILSVINFFFINSRYLYIFVVTSILNTSRENHVFSNKNSYMRTDKRLGEHLGLKSIFATNNTTYVVI